MTPSQEHSLVVRTHRNYQGETPKRKHGKEDMGLVVKRRKCEEQRERKANDWWGA